MSGVGNRLASSGRLHAIFSINWKKIGRGDWHIWFLEENFCKKRNEYVTGKEKYIRICDDNRICFLRWEQCHPRSDCSSLERYDFMKQTVKWICRHRASDSDKKEASTGVLASFLYIWMQGRNWQISGDYSSLSFFPKKPSTTARAIKAAQTRITFMPRTIRDSLLF